MATFGFNHRPLNALFSQLLPVVYRRNRGCSLAEDRDAEIQNAEGIDGVEMKRCVPFPAGSEIDISVLSKATITYLIKC